MNAPLFSHLFFLFFFVFRYCMSGSTGEQFLNAGAERREAVISVQLKFIQHIYSSVTFLATFTALFLCDFYVACFFFFTFWFHLHVMKTHRKSWHTDVSQIRQRYADVQQPLDVFSHTSGVDLWMAMSVCRLVCRTITIFYTSTSTLRLNLGGILVVTWL